MAGGSPWAVSSKQIGWSFTRVNFSQWTCCSPKKLVIQYTLVIYHRFVVHHRQVLFHNRVAIHHIMVVSHRLVGNDGRKENDYDFSLFTETMIIYCIICVIACLPACLPACFRASLHNLNVFLVCYRFLELKEVVTNYIIIIIY